MIGAILGDIIGSPYEFDRGEKTKDFPLFSEKCRFTDDTLMTIAVAYAFSGMTKESLEDGESVKKELAASMRRMGSVYPHAGYGGMFRKWLSDPDMPAYSSYGNGSAMRVSSAAWMFGDLASVRRAARLSAEVTHNHPEGVKGAEATASAIFLARDGRTKKQIKEYIEQEFGYDLSRTLDEIRPGYHHTETCMETVPEAITAFLEGENFEDVIRNAVSLGGDTDTLAAIAGSIAEGYYHIPYRFVDCLARYLPCDLLELAFLPHSGDFGIDGGRTSMNCPVYGTPVHLPDEKDV